MTLFSICDRGTEDEALPPEVCGMAPGVSTGSQGYRASGPEVEFRKRKRKRKRAEGRGSFIGGYRGDYAFSGVMLLPL